MAKIPENYFEGDVIWQCPFCGRVANADFPNILVDKEREDGVYCGCGKRYHFSLLILRNKRDTRNLRILLKGLYYDPDWEKEM